MRCDCGYDFSSGTLSRRLTIAPALLLTFWAALLIGLLFMKLPFIKYAGGGGELLWKNDEAYFFLYDSSIGYHFSVAGLLAEPINEYFYAPTPPDDVANLLSVLRVGPSGVEHWVQEPDIPITDFTPIGGSIYANGPGGIVKWTGSRFEAISNEEEQRMGGREHLISDWSEFTSDNGWSRRLIRTVGPEDTPIHGQFSIDLNNRLEIIAIEGNPTSVTLRRSNQPDQELWYYGRETVIASKAKYGLVFRPH